MKVRIEMSKVTVKFPKIKKVDVAKSIIADAKSRNLGVDDILHLVMQTLSFKRSLARVYLTHYDSVEAKRSYALIVLSDIKTI
jgi:hypothetical protein